jgi:hypothetical protein
MRTDLFFFRTLLLCAFFWLLSASSASAQCGANAVAFGDVSLIPNNPFHAELVTTGSPRPLGSLSPLYRHPELVARDREGRVRIERISGEYLRQTGPDAGTKAEMHLIMICDPVAQTLTQIDTATSSARIYHSHLRPRAVCTPRSAACRRSHTAPGFSPGRTPTTSPWKTWDFKTRKGWKCAANGIP